MGNLYALGDDLMGVFTEDGTRGSITHLPATAKGGGWEQHVCLFLFLLKPSFYLFIYLHVIG